MLLLLYRYTIHSTPCLSRRCSRKGKPGPDRASLSHRSVLHLPLCHIIDRFHSAAAGADHRSTVRLRARPSPCFKPLPGPILTATLGISHCPPEHHGRINALSCWQHNFESHPLSFILPSQAGPTYHVRVAVAIAIAVATCPSLPDVGELARSWENAPLSTIGRQALSLSLSRESREARG